MLRKHSEVFRTLCAISDASIVGASWAAAYALRFHTSLFPAPVSAPDPLSYTVLGLGILPLWYLLMRRAELYAPRRGFHRWEDETRQIVGASSLGLLILAAGTFFWQATPISRLVPSSGTYCAGR